MSLTSKQRAFLNSQAHTLKPIIQIGKNGLNDQIKTSVRQALDARELIKVTLLQNTDENIHEVAEILEEEIGVDTVQKIGRILILFNNLARKKIARFLRKSKKSKTETPNNCFYREIKGTSL
ncbi:ancient RNA-binding IF3-C fold protein [Streptococcus pneumoniae]|nr:ancient RNA-binding IF3-C fold protein [Streptococcus pneumoniae]